MVLYFTSNVVSPAAFIYVGKDKVESISSHYEHQLHLQRREEEGSGHRLTLVETRTS
jgi:hypothetical protein